ncbi:MAG: HAMP domain-containing histidine kinase, partial [Rhodobacteraceae bacterium]|nr:HAMP domain-containing histidine kinase [Paracoccaceae bacterium]
GGLAGTLALSFAGLVVLRYLGPLIGFRAAAIVLGLAIAAATAVLGWLMVRLLLRPIRALEGFALAQETARPEDAPVHFGTRELYATAQRVIAMAAALRDREATIRAFTDHVTHEVKTPVSTLRAAIELLQDSAALSDADRALVGQMEGACRQIEGQLAALRRAAQAREARYLGECCLADVVPGLAADHPGLVLTVDGEGAALPMSAEGLGIILGQLLRNAAEHRAGAVLLRAEVGGVLLVRDDGRGISAGNAARVFDPFFTTRRDVGGTGMGLAIVRNILQAHQGEISLAGAGPGAAFVLRFRTDRG